MEHLTDHEEVGSKNVDNPDAKLYSILNKLEDFRNKLGQFKFKLCYPELTWGINGSNCNEWFQTSNPYTDTAITGFEEIFLAFDENSYHNAWVGLGKNIAGGPSNSTVIDDSPTGDQFYTAIGGKKYLIKGQIPGPKHPKDWYKYSGVTKVTLYVGV